MLFSSRMRNVSDDADWTLRTPRRASIADCERFLGGDPGLASVLRRHSRRPAPARRLDEPSELGVVAVAPAGH